MFKVFCSKNAAYVSFPPSRCFVNFKERGGDFLIVNTVQILLKLFFILFIPTAALGESNEAAFEMKQTLEPKPLIVPAAANHSPLTSGEKFNFYLKATVSPASIFSSAFSSRYNQAFNTIPEWGQGIVTRVNMSRACQYPSARNP